MKLLTWMLPLLALAAPVAAQETPSARAAIPWANKFFTGNPDNPPPVILQDFKTLPKGTIKTYRFSMTNIFAVTMQVKEPRAECGCVSVVEYTGQLGPRETGHIDIKVDTSSVDGEKSIKIPVEFRGVDPKTANPVIDPKTKMQFKSQADLVVKFVSRPEIEVKPGAFEFGQVPAGQTASQTVTIVYTGRQPGWKVLEAGVRKDLFDVEWVKPPAVPGAKAVYALKLTLKADVPPGPLDGHVELKTNDPVAQAALLNLVVSGSVQAPLSVVPSDHIKFNKGVEVEQKEERTVTIRAEQPFKVQAVEGQGDGVTVPLLPVDASKSQALTVIFKPAKPGRVVKELTVKTDTGKTLKLTVEGVGTEPQ
jgi:hypothetical protein